MRLFKLAILSLLTSAAQAEKLQLASEGFAANTLFPVLYACDGKSIAPPLNWINVPKNTVSLSLIVKDLTSSKPIYQWVIYDIPASISSIDESSGALPAQILQGKNSWNKTGYYGLCPPLGKLHVYEFSLYALDKKLNLPVGVDAQTLLQAMEGSVVQKATLTASYSRWPWAQ
ncbi:MAG: YbhB/YbcL family Raf kinase inhibitor-like protein [Legionella sp.]|nr:MAG: YbhB/YbcL family Raf kinase inhibitor-like protein [Legionella sp.]